MILHEGDPDYFKSGQCPVCIICLFIACPFELWAGPDLWSGLIVSRRYNQVIVETMNGAQALCVYMQIFFFNWSPFTFGECLPV
jgi:hypothetical protein